jgi:hypothetical protein
MGIKELRAGRIKEVILAESKLRVVIRKLIPFDFLEQGYIPDTMAKVQSGDPEKMDKESLSYLFSLICAATLEVDGMRFTSEKPPVKDGFVSLWELPGDDVNQLITSVFSHRDGGEGVNPDRFPQEQKADGTSGQVGA